MTDLALQSKVQAGLLNTLVQDFQKSLEKSKAASGQESLGAPARNKSLIHCDENLLRRGGGARVGNPSAH